MDESTSDAMTAKPCSRHGTHPPSPPHPDTPSFPGRAAGQGRPGRGNTSEGSRARRQAASVLRSSGGETRGRLKTSGPGVMRVGKADQAVARADGHAPRAETRNANGCWPRRISGPGGGRCLCLIGRRASRDPGRGRVSEASRGEGEEEGDVRSGGRRPRHARPAHARSPKGMHGKGTLSSRLRGGAAGPPVESGPRRGDDGVGPA